MDSKATATINKYRDIGQLGQENQDYLKPAIEVRKLRPKRPPVTNATLIDQCMRPTRVVLKGVFDYIEKMPFTRLELKVLQVLSKRRRRVKTATIAKNIQTDLDAVGKTCASLAKRDIITWHNTGSYELCDKRDEVIAKINQCYGVKNVK